MGSETPGEKKAKEKIKDYYQLIETAYLLFDGKYSHTDIESMPYKKLIELIHLEEEMSSKELEEIKAAHKANKQLQQMR